jgi:hypothetical protein
VRWWGDCKHDRMAKFCKRRDDSCAFLKTRNLLIRSVIFSCSNTTCTMDSVTDLSVML